MFSQVIQPDRCGNPGRFFIILDGCPLTNLQVCVRRSRYWKIQVRDTCVPTLRSQRPWESRNRDWDGVWSCLWCHKSHEPCVWRHRFCLTSKPPTLNISVFEGFEKTGQTRLSCVFVVVLRWAQTLTCVIRGLHLHVHLYLDVKRVVVLSSIHCATIPKISPEILRRTLIWKMYGLVFTARVEDMYLSSYRCT